MTHKMQISFFHAHVASALPLKDLAWGKLFKHHSADCSFL